MKEAINAHGNRVVNLRILIFVALGIAMSGLCAFCVRDFFAIFGKFNFRPNIRCRSDIQPNSTQSRHTRKRTTESQHCYHGVVDRKEALIKYTKVICRFIFFTTLLCNDQAFSKRLRCTTVHPRMENRVWFFCFHRPASTQTVVLTKDEP